MNPGIINESQQNKFERTVINENRNLLSEDYVQVEGPNIGTITDIFS